jgi:hypothetical protein
MEAIKNQMRQSLSVLHGEWLTRDKSNLSPAYIIKMNLSYLYAYCLIDNYQLTAACRDEWVRFIALLTELEQENE